MREKNETTYTVIFEIFQQQKKEQLCFYLEHKKNQSLIILSTELNVCIIGAKHTR